MKEEEEESNRIESTVNEFFNQTVAVSLSLLEEERKGYFENEDDRNSRGRRRRRRGIRDAAAGECKRRSEPFRFIKFNDESPANRWHMRSLINRPRADRNGCNELSPRKGENIPGDSGKEESSNCSRSNRDAQLCSRLNFIR